VQKSRTTILGLEARTCSFEAVFSLKLKDFGIPSFRNLSTDWRIDLKQERRGRTPLEKDLKDNSRTGREIVDLLGVLFSLLFSHVVLLFKYESLCNL
jgi:hypothetical protein